MQITDLDFNYPPELVAIVPSRPTRVAFYSCGATTELTIPDLLQQFRAGDLLVINESKVIPARIFTDNEIEVLFLRRLKDSDLQWEVLFPAREFKVNDQLNLPGGLHGNLKQKGLPQILELSQQIDEQYFIRHGEVALPPYIQEARGERHNRISDAEFYQTTWAKNPGSVAAPTASLHFTSEHLDTLKAKGVSVATLTLHVGAGTFLPIRASNLNDHQMHKEWVEIPAPTLDMIRRTRAHGGKVWALGTTVTRALEAWANQQLQESANGVFGETDIFIKPPYQFQVVDALLTNFHQPRSTLLSLVAAFAGLDQVKSVYAWAVDRQFKLFSYGDLSAWIK